MRGTSNYKYIFKGIHYSHVKRFHHIALVNWCFIIHDKISFVRCCWLLVVVDVYTLQDLYNQNDWQDVSIRWAATLLYPSFGLSLTHWRRVTHICVSRLTITGSDNGLSPGRRQAIIWTNAGILLIGPLGANFSENSIEILIFSFTKMRLKVSSAKWRPFCLGLNVLKHITYGNRDIGQHWLT